jgi:hypothetical protein
LDYASPVYVKIEDHDSPSDISFLIERRMKGCATFEADIVVTTTFGRH